MFAKFRDTIRHINRAKIKNHPFVQKIVNSKATIVLITLIVGILLTRTYFYIMDSQIIISEKVTDEVDSNKLSLEKANATVENVNANDITDYKPTETQDSAIETQESGIENDIKLDGNSQNDLKSGQEYIFSASLDRYYVLDEFNKFTIEDLMSISGIGEVTANAILSYREKNGAFQSFSELVNIKGIGEKKLKKWIVSKP